MASSRYDVVLSPKADKQLDDLSLLLQRRITQALEDLEPNPRPPGAIKLQGSDDLWRIRVGEYRVVYTINDGKLLVLVVRLGHRRDIYKN